MSGHSKWHTIKHKKGAADAKRGAIFTKLIREIQTCARQGGGDPDNNARLRTILGKAKAASMPADTVNKAILRGTGQLEGVTYEEAMYEGYGPGGIAILIECLTDNKNRCAAEMRFIMTRGNGNLGAPGSVAWKFSQKGVFVFSKEKVTEEQLMDKLLEAGVEDIQDAGDMLEVTCETGDFEKIKGAIEKAGFETVSAETTKLPGDWIKLDKDSAGKAMKLLETLEEHDDVQHVYSNMDIPEDLLAE